MSDDMESIPTRVNDLEKASHTHEHRISKLEELPPRVGGLESAFSAMQRDLTHIDQRSSRIESKQDQLIETVTSMQASSQTTFRNWGILCSAISLVAIIVAWIG